MHYYDPIILKRDCDAVLIPSGTAVTLKEGANVYITQSLGDTLTVNIEGNLARIAGKDADALGLEPVADKPSHADLQSGTADESLIWEQLKTCYDPEIPINIVDLGLIYDCSVTPLPNGGNCVNVKMTLTAPGCGMGAILLEDVRRKIATVPNVTEVNAELVFDPPWNQSMMSEAARLETGLY
ncbi:MAG: putative Fe-S cluster assembly protein SufT [Gammaproteobacteria bacterium]|nr:putative Fe-S cluster assembly protein SufT [Gammaproteobacteria bacterium]MCI0591098.1 putative Fe-S cluster assembly protein SufT [Gammaproteobacteria bacterium]